MARSAPLLVVLYSGIVVNMMIAMILVYIPVYFKDVLKLEVKQVEAFLPFEKVRILRKPLVTSPQ